MTSQIVLPTGEITLVDDADYAHLRDFRWQSTNRHKRTYVQGSINGRKVALHRYLLSAPAHLQVDHINDDTLDNRRANLRLVTRSQNKIHGGKHRYRNNTSGYIGVYNVRGRWQAKVSDGTGGRISCGQYCTPEEAARARDFVALQVHGLYVRLNFPAR